MVLHPEIEREVFPDAVADAPACTPGEGPIIEVSGVEMCIGSLEVFTLERLPSVKNRSSKGSVDIGFKTSPYQDDFRAQAKVEDVVACVDVRLDTARVADACRYFF